MIVGGGWQERCVYVRAGRFSLEVWLTPRVWMVGAHCRRSCCAFNVMLGPLEFSVVAE